MGQYFEEDKNLKNQKRLIKINYKNKQYNLFTTSGVFSKEKFDYGTRLLLEEITKNELGGRALDLGCGYGVVGVILADVYPALTIDMIDITDRAIELSKVNTRKLVNVNVFKSNVYEKITKEYDYIITNPPIRAGKEIVMKFLKEAQYYLKASGELWFVMRKDHGVKSVIRELGEIYEISIKNKSKGFYVVKCTQK